MIAVGIWEVTEVLRALLIARLNAAPGRVEEFEEWYSHVHLRDALRMRGSIAAQRFRRCPPPALPLPGPSEFANLTVYDVEDPEAFARAHDEAAGTPGLVMSSAADLSSVCVHHYYPLVALGAGLRSGPAAAGVMLAEFGPGSRERADDVIDAAWRALPEGTGTRAFVAEYRPDGQLFRRPPESPLLCLVQFRCAPATAAGLLRAALGQAGAASRVTLFESAGPLLTKQEVVASGVTERESSARRVALADPSRAWARHRGAAGPP